MIAGTYLLSGSLLVVTAILFGSQSLTAASFIALLCVVFFFASAGASSAYLTVSEIFPMETRALCIGVFYASARGIGGITGPLVFQALIKTGELRKAELALMLGAAMMIVGGIVELDLRGQGRAPVARGHRQAAHRRGGGAVRSAVPADGSGDGVAGPLSVRGRR